MPVPSTPPSSSPPLSPFLLSDKLPKQNAVWCVKVADRGGGNSINHNIDGARHSSHSMGEGVWVNSSRSNAGSGSGRSSTLTSSSTTRTSSEDDEAIIADALFRVAMDLEGLHTIDVEPDGNCLFRAVSQQVYGDAERHLEASVVEK